MKQEPAWWSRAREMRGRGLSFGIIARLVKRDPTSVCNAISAELRERKCSYGQDYRRRKCEAP